MILCYITVVFGVLFVESANILGYFPIPSVSHQHVYQPIWKELSVRGHKVTVITTNPLQDPKLKNLTEIDVSSAYKIHTTFNPAKFSPSATLWSRIFFFNDVLVTSVLIPLSEEKVRKFINSDGKFDVVLLSPLASLAFAFPARFRAPVIGNVKFTYFISNACNTHAMEVMENISLPTLCLI